MLTRDEIRATTQGKIPKPANYRYGTKLTEWEPAETTLSRDAFIRQVQPMHDRIVVQLLESEVMPSARLETGDSVVVGEHRATAKTSAIILTDAKPLIGGCRRAKVLKTGPGRWVHGEWWKVTVGTAYRPVGAIYADAPWDSYWTREWRWFPGYRRPVSVLPGQVVLIGNWVDLELEDIALCAEGDVRLSWPS